MKLCRSVMCGLAPTPVHLSPSKYVKVLQDIDNVQWYTDADIFLHVLGRMG